MNEREKQEYNDAWARFYATKEAAKPKKRTKSKTGNSTKENENVSQSQKHDYVLNYKAPVSKRISRFLQEKWYVILCAIGLIIANFVIPRMMTSSDESDSNSSYSYSDPELSKYRGEWLTSDGRVWLNFINDSEVIVSIGSTFTTKYALVGSHTGVIFYSAGSVLNLSPTGDLYVFDEDTGVRVVEMATLHRRR